MQQRMVVSWLAQHNFPHGMVAFMDGLSAEPLRQKTNYLRNVVQEVRNILIIIISASEPRYRTVKMCDCYSRFLREVDESAMQ